MKLHLEELEPRDAPASLSGVWFVDVNANAVHDASEPGVAGQYVYLAAGTQAGSINVVADAVTDADGNWSMAVPVGTYTVWRPWLPDQLDTTPNSYVVMLGLDVAGLDFGRAPFIPPPSYAAWLVGFQAAFGEPEDGVNWWPGEAEYQAAQEAKAFWDSIEG